MARIDYYDTSKSNERTKEMLDKDRNANIFRMMAHSPSYFEQYCRLGSTIRSKGELDPVCAGARDHAHRHFVRGALRDRRAQADRRERWVSPTSRTRRWRTGRPAKCFNEVQRAALALPTRSSGSTSRRMRRSMRSRKLTPARTRRTAALVGFYIMTSKFLETFAIDMQPVTELV